MSVEEALGRLAQNITSEEEWEAVRHNLRDYGRNTYRDVRFMGMELTSGSDQVESTDAWYWCREATRMDNNVYQVSSVLAWVNKHAPGIYAHNGRDEDLTMVSYIPGVEDAKRDKRHKVKLGRLLVRLFPLLTDEYVRDLVVAHVNEVDPTLELLQGGEAIREVYTKGPGACMSKGLNEYSTTDMSGKRWAPTDVYDMPHISIAVTRDASGKVNGRALVLPEKKIYIRAYGSPALKAKLDRAGYEAGTFCGTELKLIKLAEPKDGVVKFVAPYIDGAGGAGKSEHSTLAVIDGKLKVLTPAQIARAKERGNSRFLFTSMNTSGYGSVVMAKASDFEQVDSITGETVDDDISLIRVFWNGSMHMTRSEVWAQIVGESGDFSVVAKVMDADGSIRTVTTLAADTFKKDGSFFLVHKDTMDYVGMVQLDPQFYGEKRIVRADKSVIHLTGSDYCIRVKDAQKIVYFDESCVPHEQQKYSKPYNYHDIGTYAYRLVVEHVSAGTKGRKLVAVMPIGGVKHYASEGVPVVKTSTNRKVIPCLHSISRLWDGGYILNNSKHQSLVIFDQRLAYVGKKPVELEEGGEMYNLVLKRVIQEAADQLLVPSDFSHLCSAFSATVDGNRISPWGTSVPSLMHIEVQSSGVSPSTAARIVCAKVVKACTESRSYNYGTVPENFAGTLADVLWDAYYRLFYSSAEARAIDYNVIDMHNMLPAEEVVNTEEAPIVIEVVNA